MENKNKENNTKRIPLLVKPSEHAILKELAWQERKSLNQFIGDVLRVEIRKKNKHSDKKLSRMNEEYQLEQYNNHGIGYEDLIHEEGE